jgi:hypothetical protein
VPSFGQNNQSCRRLLLFVHFATAKKAMTVTLPSPFFFFLQRSKKGDGNFAVVTFFFWL